jgi:hypothetical protein
MIAHVVMLAPIWAKQVAAVVGVMRFCWAEFASLASRIVGFSRQSYLAVCMCSSLSRSAGTCGNSCPDTPLLVFEREASCPMIFNKSLSARSLSSMVQSFPKGNLVSLRRENTGFAKQETLTRQVRQQSFPCVFCSINEWRHRSDRSLCTNYAWLRLAKRLGLKRIQYQSCLRSQRLGKEYILDYHVRLFMFLSIWNRLSGPYLRIRSCLNLNKKKNI